MHSRAGPPWVRADRASSSSPRGCTSGTKRAPPGAAPPLFPAAACRHQTQSNRQETVDMVSAFSAPSTTCQLVSMTAGPTRNRFLPHFRFAQSCIPAVRSVPVFRATHVGPTAPDLALCCAQIRAPPRAAGWTAPTFWTSRLAPASGTAFDASGHTCNISGTTSGRCSLLTS